MTNEDQIPSREMQKFVADFSKIVFTTIQNEFSGGASQSPSASKIKINVGVSFKPLTITVSIEF